MNAVTVFNNIWEMEYEFQYLNKLLRLKMFNVYDNALGWHS